MDNVVITANNEDVGIIRYNNDKRYDVYRTFKRYNRTITEDTFYANTYDTYTEAKAYLVRLAKTRALGK